ncbi:ThuA-like domain-containing protein OS=Cellulomonas persica OX=76861 GN=CPE01_11870 PE=4 SV=1 [Cellulomonas persica]
MLGGVVATVLVLAGAGRYTDPWHDAVAQADEVAQVARALGHDVRVRSTRPETFDEPGLLEWGPQLLVVVAGGMPRPPGDEPGTRADEGAAAGAGPDEGGSADATDAGWRRFHDARQALVDAGTAVLGVHEAAYAFADDPRWAATIGGRWVLGRSWHPPYGPATFRAVDDEHPVTWSLREVTSDDERYADLTVSEGVHVLVVADVTPDEAGEDGTAGEHPVVWTVPGPTKVLYDALGHDAAAFASPSRRALLAAELAWLLQH